METLREVAGRLTRLAAMAVLLVAVAGAALELALRLAGMEPQNTLAAATINDRWTEWSMRPHVRSNEYMVTNRFGLHEDREIALAKRPGVRRVAVMGSSVVWGLGNWLADTIPRSAEAALREAGCEAEVINFAGIGYSIVHASAYLQTKVHQFDPDAVVVAMDMRMAMTHFPPPVPAPDENATVRQLGSFEGLVKRASHYSVVLTLLDNVSPARERLARWLPLAPAKPAKSPTAQITTTSFGREPLEQAWESAVERLESALSWLKAKELTGDWHPGAKPFPAWKPPANVEPAIVPGIAEYEALREKQLAGVVAATSAFAREMRFPLYFVTPYGPYFGATREELSKFSLEMLGPAARVYGRLDTAARREAELTSSVIARTAPREGARVIDLLPLTRRATMATGDFSADGVHLSVQGNRRVGALIAERLLKDGLCATARP